MVVLAGTAVTPMVVETIAAFLPLRPLHRPISRFRPHTGCRNSFRLLSSPLVPMVTGATTQVPIGETDSNLAAVKMRPRF